MSANGDTADADAVGSDFTKVSSAPDAPERYKPPELTVAAMKAFQELARLVSWSGPKISSFDPVPQGRADGLSLREPFDGRREQDRPTSSECRK
jgi:hypothetical protein